MVIGVSGNGIGRPATRAKERVRELERFHSATLWEIAQGAKSPSFFSFMYGLKPVPFSRICLVGRNSRWWTRVESNHQPVD